MPDFEVTSPQGKKFVVTAPDGASQDQVLSYAQKNFQSDKADAPEEKPSTASDVFQSGASGMAEGAVGLATFPLDVGMKLGGYLANKTGEFLDKDYVDQKAPSAGEAINKKLGLDYEPKTTPGKFAKTVGSFLPSAGLNPGSAKKAIGMAAGSGAVSEGAGELTQGTWAEPWARLLGGLTPSAIEGGGAAALKGTLRGGTSATDMEQNINKFEKTGATPSVGQAAESYVPRAIESFLSKMPGSAGEMRKFSYDQGQKLGEHVDSIAGQLSPAASGEVAGAAIKKGIEDKFIPEVRKEQKALYDLLDQFMPQGTFVGAQGTMSVLEKMTKGISGAENLSNTKLLSNPLLDEVKEALKKDMGGTPGTKPTTSSILDENGRPLVLGGTPGQPGGATMPYQALKDLRSRIGDKLETVDLAPDVPKAQLKQLYAALSTDMQTATKAAGPLAQKAFEKANAYTREFHEKIDRIQTIIDKQDPEKIFRSAMSGTAEGATGLRVLMKALPEDGRKALSAAVIRRLGRATPSNQNDVGNVFSTGTFLTNWNKLSPAAKSTLFDGYGAGFSYDMDRLATVADDLKNGSEVFKNPSGTAGANELITTGGSIGSGIMALLLGHPAAAGAVAAGLGSSYGLSKMMTDPRFVHWLAQTTEMPESAAPAAIASLRYTMQSDPDSQQ